MKNYRHPAVLAGLLWCFLQRSASQPLQTVREQSFYRVNADFKTVWDAAQDIFPEKFINCNCGSVVTDFIKLIP